MFLCTNKTNENTISIYVIIKISDLISNKLTIQIEIDFKFVSFLSKCDGWDSI